MHIKCYESYRVFPQLYQTEHYLKTNDIIFLTNNKVFSIKYCGEVLVINIVM